MLAHKPERDTRVTPDAERDCGVTLAARDQRAEGSAVASMLATRPSRMVSTTTANRPMAEGECDGSPNRTADECGAGEVAQQVGAHGHSPVVHLRRRCGFGQDRADSPHVGSQHFGQRRQIAAGAGRDESLGDQMMFGVVDDGGDRCGCLDLDACAARELTACRGRSADGVGDVVERHPKHVVQHERDPFGGGESAQYLEQCIVHLVIEVTRSPGSGIAL